MVVAPLVVFDLDGTLADTAGDLVSTLNVILAREGVSPLPFDVARSLVGAGARALISRGLATAGRAVSAERLEELFSAFLAYYEAHIADHSRLFPGVVESLDRFAGAGYRFAVCTNKIEAASVQLLTALGIADRFAAICGQDTFAACKPDPSALYMTIERAGGVPVRSVMVGDSRTDIDTAKAARIPVVAVDFGYSDEPVAHFEPDRLISHFDDAFAAVESLMAARSSDELGRGGSPA